MSSKELEKRTVGDLVLPEWMSKVTETGTEQMGTEDISMPHLKIVQALSPIMKENENARMGNLYDKLTGEIYGNTVNVFPLLFWRSRVWFNDDFEMERAEHRSVSTGEIIENGKPVEECTGEALDSYNYFMVLEKELEEAIKTNCPPMPTRWMTVKAANSPTKQLNSKLKINANRGIPIFGQLITIGTKLVTFKKGEAYVPTYAYGRFATNEEAGVLMPLYQKAVELQSGTASTTNGNDEVPF